MSEPGVARAASRFIDRRRPLLLLVLAALTLVAWAFASPIGSSPDDDYHLTSSWCAGPAAGELCEPGEAADERVVPEALTDIACYAYDPEESAACQGEEFDWSTSETVETGRGNFSGEYPPVYYAVTGLLTGGDIQVSALLMRLLSVALFLGLSAALWSLLPERRTTLVWAWLATMVPLGTFLLASNNPSAWAIIGVGSSWLALLGYVESTGRRRIGLGAVFVVATLAAAGSRGDAALYAGLAIAVVFVLTVTPTWRYAKLAVLPAVLAVVALVLFLTSRQVGSGLQGFGAGGSGSGAGSGAGEDGGLEAVITGPALLAYNVLNLPSLWAGLLTEGGLGWLDVQMPSLVSFAVVGVFLVLAFVGLARVDRRRAIALLLVGLVLVALPLYVLQAGGDRVGQQVQPRYLLPLIVLFAGLLLLSRAGAPLRVSRLQGWLIGAALAGAHFVALHLTMRRYITGIDGAGFDLGAGAEWWWVGPVGPNAVWLLGALAFALLVSLAVPLLTRPAATALRGQVPEGDDGDAVTATQARRSSRDHR